MPVPPPPNFGEERTPTFRLVGRKRPRLQLGASSAIVVSATSSRTVDATMAVVDASPPSVQTVALRVTVRARLFVGGDDDGYAVLRAVLPSGEQTALTGPGLARFEEDDAIEVSGEWRDHARYGRQFHVHSAALREPEDVDEQVAFLAQLPGIGPVRARKLLSEHGQELFARLDADPVAVFSKLPRFNSAKIQAAAEAWRQCRGDRDLYALLAPFRLTRLVGPLS